MPDQRRGTLVSALELMRPANIVTALADILAGFAAAGGAFVLTGNGYPEFSPDAVELVLLLFSTVGLYGGGVVYNDVFDADLDARERPRRPIPSGRITKGSASLLGGILLVFGVFLAYLVNPISGTIALSVALLALVYDRWAKHHTYIGPLVMGACRGGNLLLGVSIVPFALLHAWYLAFIPVAYIAAITLVSQGEVHGGNRATGYLAVGLVLLVLASLASLTLRSDFHILRSLPFWLLFGVMVLPAFLQAARTPEPRLIRRAIKRGVLSLILLNSTLAAGFSGIPLGVLILVLLPVSMLLGRLFAVT